MKPKKNKVIVTRKWLLDFADTIYNPKTKEFLSLCDGTLQNGPDPEDKKRVMHCGLGELYFQLTGKQPKAAHVEESGVIAEVIEHSSLLKVVADEKVALKKLLDNLKVPGDYNIEEKLADLKEAVDDFYPTADDDRISNFREVLNDIPHENDDDSGVGTIAVYRARSKRVAGVLRRAAKLLPA